MAAKEPNEGRPGLVITAGGLPSPAELAALTVAVTSAAAASTTVADASVRTVPAWRRAALLEQTRRPRAVRPSDLADR